MKIKNFVLVAIAVATLVACGGGDGTPATATSTLSVTQQNFEASTVKDSYVYFDFNLPTRNTAVVSGVNFFYTNSHSAPTSPSNGVVVDTITVTNLTTGLALPDRTHRNVKRVLKSGVIYVSNYTSKLTWSYKESNVVQTTYATDGLTPVEIDEYDSWSTPTPLSGQIGNSNVLKSYEWFLNLNAPLNFDFTKSWLAGASYITRKGFYQSDVLEVYDWTGDTYDSNVTAYTGTETTIEAFFSQASFVSAGGFSVDNVLYNLSDGTISSVQGARTWIATNKRPSSFDPTDNYLAVLELNGKLYIGGMRKANTRFKKKDSADATIVHDDSIRLNTNAADSIKQTVKF